MKQGVLRTSPSIRSRSRWSSRLGAWTDFFNPVSCTWSDFTGLFSTLLDSCRLFLSPGPLIPCGQLPLASLHSERGTVLLLRIVKERVDLTVLFSTYFVNTFWCIIQNALLQRQIAIQDTMRHIDDRFSAGVSRLVRDPVRTRPVVVRCGWWLNSPV